ncbi:MAG: hypothetical protein LBT23_11945, partial [Synergistaceae bacterium]|nr:hypothetical protein [Synergistaceae bacterium]
GSRTPIAVTILVKKPDQSEKASVYYHDIGDYLTREEKLAIIAKSENIYSPKIELSKMAPNDHGDWLNQRTDIFSTFLPLGDKDDKTNEHTVFAPFYSNGLKTQRDPWCYNYSKTGLESNIRGTIDFYNEQRNEYNKQRIDYCAAMFLNRDSRKISWTRALIENVERNTEASYTENGLRDALYRPFCKQNLYFDRTLNEMSYQIPKLFPTSEQKNLVICVPAMKSGLPLVVENIPDLHFNGDSQCFPLYFYERKDYQQKTLFDTDDEYNRRDGITDFIQKECRSLYGPRVTKEDIFYYVYGLLHSNDYREKFAADLKKALPRLPLVEKPADFWSFSKSGRELAELHLNYENYSERRYDIKITGEESGDFRVGKMSFLAKDEYTGIRYNSHITITNIPLAAYDYVVNGKSAIEWIMERYQVKIDKESGIKNDPNDWAEEQGKPRYILDLLLSVIAVSVETAGIVERLPGLD